jgi:hypothetical protein
MYKVNFTVEVPENYLVTFEQDVKDYVEAIGGNYLDYHIFYDDSWLKDNDPHYRKLISDRAKMSKHINDYRNKSSK